MATLVNVKARRNEPTDRLIKRFSKKVRREGILEEARDRMLYEKPYDKARKARRRRKKVLESLKKDKK
jgi:ribosomal protein S21